MKLASAAVVLISFYYLGRTLYQYGIRVDPAILGASLTTILFAVVLVHYTGFVLMSWAWHLVLRFLGNRITLTECFYIIAKTQLAKYIPGNVFHYAGRHVLGAQIGVSQGDLITSVLYESVWYAFASILMGTGSLLLYSHAGFAWHTSLLAAGAVGGAFLFSAYVVVYLNKIKNLSVLSSANFFRFLRLSLFSISIYSLMLVLYSLVFWALGRQITLQEISFFPFAAAYCLSWVIGFITPGAPGGLGVREAVMVAVLSGSMEKPDILALAVIFRLATIIAEVLLFITTLFMPAGRGIEPAETNNEKIP